MEGENLACARCRRIPKEIESVCIEGHVYCARCRTSICDRCGENATLEATVILKEKLKDFHERLDTFNKYHYVCAGCEKWYCEEYSLRIESGVAQSHAQNYHRFNGIRGVPGINVALFTPYQVIPEKIL